MNKKIKLFLISSAITIGSAFLITLIANPKITIDTGKDMPDWITSYLRNFNILPRTISLKDSLFKRKNQKEILKVKFKIF
ncbi:MAG: hypothetical protein ACUVQP_08840 [Bacteroidales bacterium]